MKYSVIILAAMALNISALAEDAATAPATAPATQAAVVEKKQLPTEEEVQRNALNGVNAVLLTIPSSNVQRYRDRLELVLRHSGIRVVSPAEAIRMKEEGRFIPELSIIYNAKASQPKLQNGPLPSGFLGSEMILRLQKIVSGENGKQFIATVYEESWSTLRADFDPDDAMGGADKMITTFANRVMAANGR